PDWSAASSRKIREPPLSVVRNNREQLKKETHSKAELKPPHTRRSARFSDAGYSRSVWSAAASAPLSCEPESYQSSLDTCRLIRFSPSRRRHGNALQQFLLAAFANRAFGKTF